MIIAPCVEGRKVAFTPSADALATKIPHSSDMCPSSRGIKRGDVRPSRARRTLTTPAPLIVIPSLKRENVRRVRCLFVGTGSTYRSLGRCYSSRCPSRPFPRWRGATCPSRRSKRRRRRAARRLSPGISSLRRREVSRLRLGSPRPAQLRLRWRARSPRRPRAARQRRPRMRRLRRQSPSRPAVRVLRSPRSRPIRFLPPPPTRPLLLPSSRLLRPRRWIRA